MLCQDCSKRETCTKLCDSAERYANQDYVRQKEQPIEILNSRQYQPLLKSLPSFKPLKNYYFLTSLQNKCLQLFYNEGLPYKQIAFRLSTKSEHVSYHKVKNCIYLAKRVLLEKYSYK